jgi:hypothetical protein
VSTAPAPAAKEQRAKSEVILAIAVLGVVAVLVMPLPALALDGLLALSVGICLLVLLVALGVSRPLDFSVFPSLLLIVTLFRLGLNVATTRLILLNGAVGLRSIRSRRQSDRRRGSISDSAGGELRGHHPRFWPGGRGGGPIHVGRSARQADVDRRRPGRRYHR